MDNRTGFTLIELMVVVAILGFLIGIGVIAMNPAGQLASARNQKRQLDLETLMVAVRANVADQSTQTFSCAAGLIPTSTPARMSSVSSSANYNIAPCIVPTYILALPFDSGTSSAHYASNSDYDTGYNIIQNASTGQITLSAPAAELGKSISIIR